MGKQKEEMESASEAWHRKAKYEGYTCSICHEVINYEDREQYFITKMCSYHAHVMQKDD